MEKSERTPITCCDTSITGSPNLSLAFDELKYCGSCLRLSPVTGRCPYEPLAHSMMPVSECPVPEVRRVVDLSMNPRCPDCGRHTRRTSHDPCEGAWFWCGFCACGPIAGPRPGDILDRTKACEPGNEQVLRGVQ